MLRNYFKIAFRNIRRYSVHSILNIVGMAIGMACAILLFLWAGNELSYDRFHKKADSLYRVTCTEKFGGRSHQQASTPFQLAAALKEEYPEIIRSSRYHNMQVSFKKGDDKIIGQCAFADRDFFDMFDIEFIIGDKSSALTKPYEILITQDFATRYYGKEDPLGKSIIKGPDELFTVVGVIKNVPRNSHFYFDCIISNEFYSTQYGKNTYNTSGWQSVYNYTIIELLDKTDPKLVEGKIKNIIQRKKDDSNAEIYLQNIRDIHLNSKKYEFDIASGNIQYVQLAGLLAILILAIACINFMNILTAQSAGRAKEIGVRKMAGAKRHNIIFQFLGESLLTVFFAHIFSMILVELLLPGFNNLMHANLEVNYLSPGLYLSLFVVVLFSGFLAGSYPAFYLSSLEPLTTIRNMVDDHPGKARFRKALVITQFALSLLFIICTITVRKQLNYMSDIDLGQNINNVCYFDIPEDFHHETLKKELSSNPGIIGVSITGGQNVLNNFSFVPDINWQGKKEGEEVSFSVLNADKDYAKTFQIEVKQGTFLSVNELSQDTNVVVINEKAAEILSFKNPVGELISTKNGMKYKIEGVVKNFYYKSLHSSIGPLIIAPKQPSAKGGKCYISINPDNILSSLNSIRNTLNKLNPGNTPELRFLKDDFDNMFFVERIASVVLGYMTILAIFISCLGLIGLADFMILRRIKEIGIRKANGAKTGEIFSILTREYFRLVLISFAISGPVAWYVTNIWLRGYVYRINVSWWIFALALVIVLVITVITLGFQTYRAASRNPVEALRYE